MSAKTEMEGRALMAFVAGLAGAFAALADRATSQAAPWEVGDALDSVVRGFQHGEGAVRQALASYQALGTELSMWWSTWLSHRVEELERRHQAEQAERKREVGR